MALGDVHLTPQLVQAVRDTADLVSLAGEHTRLKKAGRQYLGLCPIHKEKTPSFQVDPDKGLFYCFGCGAGGDAIRLHMLTTGDDFPAAIESLAERYGIPLPARGSRRGRDAGPDVHRALEAAAEFFADQLAKDASVRGYLERRRVPPELVEQFGLGYAPDGWRNLLEALRQRVPLADLEAAGLVARSDRGGEPYDRFRNRLIFPIRSPAGRLVGFGGRTLGDDRAKYVNTAETESFHKSHLLYGLHEVKRSLRETGRALLVEGYFDVLGALAAGVPAAVASMGTSLTAEQVKLLGRFAEEVVVGYDGDEAGAAAAERALPLLLAGGLGVRRARFGEGHDPDSLRLEAGDEAVLAAVEGARDAVLDELDRLIPPRPEQDPRGRAAAATAVSQLLSPIPDAIVRMGYGRRAAQRLGVPEDLLWKRGGKDRRTAEVQATPPEPSARLTRLLEEMVLARLVAGAGEVPALERLPSPEVFFDPQCRSLYQAFCDAYGELAEVPDDDAVRHRLEAGGEEVARLAAILHAGQDEEVPTEGLRFGLPEILYMLERRFLERRQKELAAALREAQQNGDLELLESLVEKKQLVSRRLHRGAASA